MASLQIGLSFRSRLRGNRIVDYTSAEAWMATAIAGEIEAILPTYPQHPYQRVFADRDVKQRLIDYVLKQVPRKSPIDGMSAGSAAFQRKPSNSQLDQLRVLVHLGLVDVLRDITDRPRVVRMDNFSDNEPSHWFG